MKNFEQEIVKILPDLKEAMTQGLSYGGELFERFIQYKIITSIIAIVVSLVFVFTLKIVYEKVLKKEEDWSYPDGLSIFAIIYIVLVLFFSGISFFINSSELLKAIYVPELLLINLF